MERAGSVDLPAFGQLSLLKPSSGPVAMTVEEAVENCRNPGDLLSKYSSISEAQTNSMITRRGFVILPVCIEGLSDNDIGCFFNYSSARHSFSSVRMRCVLLYGMQTFHVQSFAGNGKSSV